MCEFSVPGGTIYKTYSFNTSRNTEVRSKLSGSVIVYNRDERPLLNGFFALRGDFFIFQQL